ncbi:hypothetical protein IBB80_04240 [Listeria marthii]|uniref:hypothetical protein n=1 Tax=Listeria marthii TaxID=529731 RepID=UPI001623371A|nr:hypothetical protein [Listeria marthii]MBC2062849.1 hypothetical protein [Listeria marthii]MBF2347733.1 hypothetical protein [Listeria marthii]MBF2502581.1 hypothetical protein [Listeria marthii]MBF2674471.1 hypothetical protein [Listeria marthii]
MFLKMTKIKEQVVENQIIMEKVVDDLLMIEIKVDINKSKDYYNYWRLTKTVEIPPLEIGIDEDGSIQTIVFYIDETHFSEIKYTEPKNEYGLLEVDTASFKKKNDFIDIDEEYYIFLNGKELICYFEKEFIPDSCYVIDRIKFYMKADELIGFSINDLSETEFAILSSIRSKLS